MGKLPYQQVSRISSINWRSSSPGQPKRRWSKGIHGKSPWFRFRSYSERCPDIWIHPQKPTAGTWNYFLERGEFLGVIVIDGTWIAGIFSGTCLTILPPRKLTCPLKNSGWKLNFFCWSSFWGTCYFPGGGVTHSCFTNLHSPSGGPPPVISRV